MTFHYGRCVHDHLDWTFSIRWIGCGSPVSWPLRSSLLYSFFRNAMMSLVYNMPFSSEMELVVQISIAAAMICELPGIFEHGHQSMSHPCACIYTNGRNFQHLLWCFYVIFLFCNKAFYIRFYVVALLFLCIFISLGLYFCPCFPMKMWLFRMFCTSPPSLYGAFRDAILPKCIIFFHNL